MTAGFRLLGSNDAEWDRLVSRTPHDVYHLSGYARVSDTHEPYPVKLAVAEDGKHVLVLPVIIRPLPPDVPNGDGWCDVTGPYGYPVPVASTDNIATLHGLAEVLWAGLRQADAVTAFLRWHPFLGIPRAALTPAAIFVKHGEHVVVWLEDLSPDPLVSLRHGHRTDIRSALRHGYTVRIDDAEDWVAFPELYRATMQRAEARAYYFFPDAYFEALRQELCAQARLVSVAAPDGSLAASGILFICGPIAHYHLSCVHEAHLASAPTKLVVLGMMGLARDSGATRLNLGSGIGGARDSLYEFKAGFSSGRAPFESARVVLDAERYELLSRSISAPDDFFPTYRYER